MKVLLTLLVCSFLALCSVEAQKGTIMAQQYIRSRVTDNRGREIVAIGVPAVPPVEYNSPATPPSDNSVVINDVPAYKLSFGSSPTSAAMAAGFYDNHGYPSMYAGPTNGGIAPMTSSIWGTAVINGAINNLCPLSATRQNLDGRLTRGHVDDYWISVNSTLPDPYITNGWTQHVHELCTGDFMGSSQSALGNNDGETTFYYYADGSPMYDYTGAEPGSRDGCHGLRLFYESRGYSIVQNYTQPRLGYSGNTLGFTFDQYKNEIDNGRPVLVQLAGICVLGYGYEEFGDLIYFRDTYDYEEHSMIWGESYNGMEHWGVTVVELIDINSPPIVNFNGNPTSVLIGQSVSFTDLSTGNPTIWDWTFEGGIPSSSTLQNPVITYNTPGTYDVTLVAVNANGSGSETFPDYITVSNPPYCTAGGVCDEYISNVTLGSINNSSACGTNGYTNFSYLTTNLAIGQSYTITVTNGTPQYPADQCGIWIDWNRDFDFTENGEFISMNGSPGVGPYSATFTVPSGASIGQTGLRVRIMEAGTLTPCGQAMWGEVEDYSVNIVSGTSSKTLNLNVLLEGLYDPSTGLMNKAQNATGNQFPGNIADQITIKLAQVYFPYTILTQAVNVNLDRNGNCIAGFSSAFNGFYYIVVSHRNHITTWSGSPVSFTGSTVNYNFTNAQSKAYGHNMILKGSKYCIYGGDVNQDGLVDSSDMIEVDNSVILFETGYLPEDGNGDGLIDSSDMILVDNNSTAFVGMIAP